MRLSLHRHTTPAFSLVELLIVIAIIAIMASIVIAAFSNASADSREVLIHQQQAVVQEAVNSWIAYNSSGTHSLASAKTLYAAADTSLARLALVQTYLDDATYRDLHDNTSDNAKVQSGAMAKTGRYIDISGWDDTHPYPRVTLGP